jgi:tRNA (guanine-N7-)-methyltransferase
MTLYLLVAVQVALYCNAFSFTQQSGALARCKSVLPLSNQETFEGTSDTDNIISDEDERKREWERRLRKDERCKAMPLSQRWYKNMQQNLSTNQKRLLREFWPIFGIDLIYGSVIDFATIRATVETPYQITNDVVLDIGFGLGDSITQMAYKHPEKLYIGCEIHRAGLASAIDKALALKLTNMKLVKADITMLLSGYVPDSSLSEVCVYFPDPWPNVDRDGGRRVIRQDILDLLSKLMKDGAVLRIATDVEDYASYVRDIMNQQKAFQLLNEVCHPPCVGGPDYRPVTKYERRAIELGHQIWDFEYKYTANGS